MQFAAPALSIYCKAGRPCPRDCGWTDPHLAALQIQEITAPVIIGALQIRPYDLSYWAAAIIAAARALGCREALSEDMSHGREIEGITIGNPFR